MQLLHFLPADCAVEISLNAELSDKLCCLNDEYAYMLMVLKRSDNDISDKDLFIDLKEYLNGLFSTEKSFSDCPSLKCVVTLLEHESKISLFDIRPLVFCCKRSFLVPEVRQIILNYDTQLNTFWSGVSLKNFRCSLKERIEGIKGMAEVTVKLDDTAVNYTSAEIIKKLPYELFGVSSKALILCEVHQGCVCITWCVPSSLVPTLREKAEQLSSEYLASKGVLELVIGLRIVPNEG